jgi:hypothetical protein
MTVKQRAKRKPIRVTNYAESEWFSWYVTGVYWRKAK